MAAVVTRENAPASTTDGIELPKMEAEQTRLQMLWDRHMQNIAKYVRYTETAVLLISWEEGDLYTKPEVSLLISVSIIVQSYLPPVGR
jgi:hypothetical protein